MNRNLLFDQQNDGNHTTTEDLIRVYAKQGGGADVNNSLQLNKALRRKDWKEIEQFVSKKPDVLLAHINDGNETLISTLAACGDDDEALRLLEKFLPMLSSGGTEKKNIWGETALIIAAQAGNTKAAKILVRFNKNLPNIKNNMGEYPIFGAAIGGHMETIKYLLSVTNVKDSSPFAGESGFVLLSYLIQYNFFEIALDLLKRYPELARDEYYYRRTILQTLVTKGFASGSRRGYWKHLIYQYIRVQEECLQSPQTKQNDVPERVEGDTEDPIHNPSTNNTAMATTFGALSQKINIMFWNALIQLAPCVKSIHETKLMHTQAVEIVRMICSGVEWNYSKASYTLKMPVIRATKLGIYEIVNEILDVYPTSYMFVNEDGQYLLMIAVLHRQEKLFKILNQELGAKIMLESYFDKSNNNILHLAGRLVPSSEVAGAALQMQRELQWFEAVKNCVSPSLQEKLNDKKETPEEIFIKEHKKLVEEGEKWMKVTAESCSVVVSLIITVVFAAAFTVPGGNNSQGIPIFLQDKPFIVFIISDGLALFSSTTSLLMFLGILTSRYSQEDFLVSLPKKLMIGLISMFFSIAALMVAFGATVYIVLSHPWKWAIIPIALLGCIPITLFALLQFPLLVEIFLSTYRPSLSNHQR